MCGIAGVIYRGGAEGPADGAVGRDMTRMLQAMRHRGADSTGYALYGEPSDLLVMRFKLADPTDEREFDFRERLERNRHEVEARLAKLGASIDRVQGESEYAYRATFRYQGELKPLADYVEDVPGAEVLSLGHSLEIVKDLGDAETVARQYRLNEFRGTHAIGHVRMATESDVDIAGAHPYWAYPFSDVAVVHNGQLTNYHQWRRRLERLGHRFQSECDSEIIAVYIAQRMADGLSLETAMKQSLDDLDGVFTYLIVTSDQLGVAKDEMAAKPLVLYEGPDGEGRDMVALASEEVAIRAVVNREIDTYDPYEREVLVWSR
jgi:glutamate synthase domain-containing protein 1